MVLYKKEGALRGTWGLATETKCRISSLSWGWNNNEQSDMFVAHVIIVSPPVRTGDWDWDLDLDYHT